MAEKKSLTEKNFEAEVIKSAVPVLVDFWAPWCGPCRMMGPVVDELAAAYVGRAKVCKVNTDESPALASDHGISAIPTFLLFKGGKLVKTLVGLQTRESLAAQLDKLL